jgi:hypothetical protein
MPPSEQRLRLPLSWGFIARVRSTVAEALSDQTADLRDAAVMVASELAENVIKYGEPLGDEECGFVSLVSTRDSVLLRTTNGVSSPERAAFVARQIEEIATSEDVGALYEQRMLSLLSSSEPDSQLGLLRIAYEGNFRLSCSYQAPRLTICAERKLS